MHPREVLEANLSLVERVIGRVCARARMYGPDAEDFASHVKLALIDDDYAVLRKWEGGSLATYLAVVIQRMLIDVWRARGRWQPSAEARRLGRAAVELETLLVRDGRSISDAVPAVQRIDASLSINAIEQLAARLPRRLPPPRSIPISDEATEELAGAGAADERVRAADVRRMSSGTNRVVREALARMALEDRMLIRLRFLSSMTIADIARMMSIPQRPLYRRLEALLGTLRQELAAAGIDGAQLADVIANPEEEIDFGWKTDDPLPSSPGSGGEAIEEDSR
jgi:RNA polymerase sigma factor for flagellar operon FliA